MYLTQKMRRMSRKVLGNRLPTLLVLGATIAIVLILNSLLGENNTSSSFSSSFQLNQLSFNLRHRHFRNFDNFIRILAKVHASEPRTKNHGVNVELAQRVNTFDAYENNLNELDDAANEEDYEADKDGGPDPYGEKDLGLEHGNAEGNEDHEIEPDVNKDLQGIGIGVNKQPLEEAEGENEQKDPNHNELQNEDAGDQNELEDEGPRERSADEDDDFRLKNEPINNDNDQMEDIDNNDIEQEDAGIINKAEDNTELKFQPIQQAQVQVQNPRLHVGDDWSGQGPKQLAQPPKNQDTQQSRPNRGNNDPFNQEDPQPRLADPAKTSPSIHSGQKYLIYLCDKKRECGGWGDRQRAFVSMFLLALVTGRRFGINMTAPCDIRHFLRPNRYNWIVDESELVNKTSIVIDDMNSRLMIKEKLKVMKFDVEYPQEVVYIRTNGEYWMGLRINPIYKSRMPKWALGFKPQFFREAWNTLVSLTPSLQERIDQFVEKVEYHVGAEPLVCAHVRIGRSETGLKKDSEVRGNMTDLPVLFDFLDKNWMQRKGSKLFIATDNVEVRNLTHLRFKGRVYDSGLDIVHIDRVRKRFTDAACSAVESALLDQQILTLCNVLITGMSTFSQRAAFIRGSSDNLYSFIKGNISKISLKGVN